MKIIFTQKNILDSFFDRYYTSDESKIYESGYDDYKKICEKANFKFVHHSNNFIAEFDILETHIIHYIEAKKDVRFNNTTNELETYMLYSIYNLADNSFVYDFISRISVEIEKEED